MTMHVPSLHRRSALRPGTSALGLLGVLGIAVVFTVVWLLVSATVEPTTPSTAWTAEQQAAADAAYRADERAGPADALMFTVDEQAAAWTSYRAGERADAPTTDLDAWNAFRAGERAGALSPEELWRLFRADER